MTRAAHAAARLVAVSLAESLLDRVVRVAGVSARELHEADPRLLDDLVELALDHQRRWLEVQDGDRDTPLVPVELEDEARRPLPRGVER